MAVRERIVIVDEDRFGRLEIQREPVVLAARIPIFVTDQAPPAGEWERGASEIEAQCRPPHARRRSVSEPTVIVPGEYRYAGHLEHMRPPETPQKCKIFECTGGVVWRAMFGRLCAKHLDAKRARIRRLADRIQVPGEPVCGLANARRGTMVFGTYYLGDGPDNQAWVRRGLPAAREADCALVVRRLNFIAEEKAYVVREFCGSG